MASPTLIRQVQRLYPLLYFACHHSHRRGDGLSERDLRILHHLAADAAPHASGLARHLGLSRSTLSEALEKLERRGLILRSRGGSNRKMIALTAAGDAALESSDGLDGTAIGEILAQLGEDEQRRVIEGLELIGRAVRGWERSS